ncbi:UDP-3-O-acyl-N-acetylglucosamine deacetylase [Acuticoccus sediminis]|uniref:UDP-3-O-acyl-N-acetylglucosamine deacetylase n=1 Tax=Acuticoccus sediminis TaxID=2184697 RepID=UPI001CFE828B|nr:UDP-3-O-acyl-N-acetylglucosamine deacetylase [Acuticoccus sediminis]
MVDEYAPPARRLMRPVTFRGVGVHTGADVACVVNPGEDGVRFHRTDTGGTVTASWRHVAATQLQTVIRSDETSVATVEHLMSAMSALGIWAAEVEIDGPEVPILDGSAAPFLAALADASEPVEGGRAVRVLQPVSVRIGRGFASLLPFPSRRFDVGIDFADAAIGEQRALFDFAAGDYGAEVAPARTFGRLKDIKRLRRRGFGRGASLDNAVAVDGATVVNPEGLRFADEFARHKLLDAVGDLALAEAPILGLYRSHRGGHRLNYALLDKLFARAENFQLLPN